MGLSGVRPLPILDPFRHADEMILDSLSAVKARNFGLVDDLLKIAIVGVSEYLSEVTAGPEFVSSVVDTADVLER